MPRSSRHKSQKQSKHSSRDDREYSDSDGDVKIKGKSSKDEALVKVSRDSYSREKQKPISQSRDGNDSSSYPNGVASEEHISSRNRKDRVDVAATDRWNGAGDVRNDSVVDKDGKEENIRRAVSEKGSKSKTLVDSKSKANRRHEGAGEKRDIRNEKEEKKRSKVDSNSKTDKDSRQDIASEKEERKRVKVESIKMAKEKELISEKDRKRNDVKHDTEKRGGDGEVKRRQLKIADSGGERDMKRSKNDEPHLQDELKNPELQKHNRSTNGSSERDKHQNDSREGDEKRLSSRGDHSKNEKNKDERLKAGGDRDKKREDVGRDHRHKDRKQREDTDREKRHKEDKYEDDKYGSKQTRDGINSSEGRSKKQRQNDPVDGSVCDDKKSRLKDETQRKRSHEKDDQSDLRSQNVKDQRHDAERKSGISKLDLSSDRSRSYSRHIDVDSRRRSSPKSGLHASKDQYRQSKQYEGKFRHSGSEEKSRPNTASSREVTAVSGAHDNSSMGWSKEKSLQNEETHLAEFSAEKRVDPDPCVSPKQRTEKSLPPSSRYSNRANLRRSIDTEDAGNRSSSFKDTRNYSGNESREASQNDGDGFPPSFGRNPLTNNSKSFLPPPPPPLPSRPGVVEDDYKGALSNQNQDKRLGDSSTGRSWLGAANWPSSVPNGFIPFQHAPQAVGFHPGMQPFPAPPMFGMRHSRELNHSRFPYHIPPDSDRFSNPYAWQTPLDDSCPTLWNSNNGVVMGNDAHMYGRVDWEHSRTMISGQGWDTGMELWKQNGRVMEKEGVQGGQGDPMDSKHLGDTNEVDMSTDIAIDGSSDASGDMLTQLIPDKSKDDRASLSQFYLTKIDISEQLTDPELYNRCASLLDPPVEDKNVDEDSSHPLFFEEDSGGGVRICTNSKSVSLFTSTDDSVFQRAVSLYKKQKEEMKRLYVSYGVEKGSAVSRCGGGEEGKAADAVPACGGASEKGSKGADEVEICGDVADTGMRCAGAGAEEESSSKGEGVLVSGSTICGGGGGGCEVEFDSGLVHLSRIHNSESTH